MNTVRFVANDREVPAWLVQFEFNIGISPSGKARDFDSRIRKFEPSYPSQGLRPLNFSPAYESLKRSFMNLIVCVSNGAYAPVHQKESETAQTRCSVEAGTTGSTTSSAASRQKL